MRKLIHMLLCLTLLGGGSLTSAESFGLSMGDAIDKAGRQRMLTQRMIKAYAMEGMQLRPDAAYEINEAAELFSSQLSELRKFAANDEEKQQVAKITLLWSELRPDVLSPPSLNNASELNELAELLLQESHQLVLMLERRSGKLAGKLVNTSGRQRMLSQRIAKIYLLQTWGLENTFLNAQYSKAVGEFDSALGSLMSAPINTTEIDRDLAQVNKNWQVFGISNYSQRYNTRVPSLVVRSMDRILKQMNTITGKYAKLH